LKIGGVIIAANAVGVMIFLFAERRVPTARLKSPHQAVSIPFFTLWPKTLIYRRTPPLYGRTLLLAVLMIDCLPAPFISLALATPRRAPVVYMPFTQARFGDLFAGERIDQTFPIIMTAMRHWSWNNKPLTGQSMPSLSNQLARRTAFRLSHDRARGRCMWRCILPRKLMFVKDFYFDKVLSLVRLAPSALSSTLRNLRRSYRAHL